MQWWQGSEAAAFTKAAILTRLHHVPTPMILFHSRPQGGEEFTIILIAREETVLTLCDIPGHFEVLVECLCNREDVWK